MDDSTPVSMDQDGNYLNARGQRIGKSAFPDEYAAARRNAMDVAGEEYPPIGPGLTVGHLPEQSSQGRRMARGENPEAARESKRMAREPVRSSQYDPNRADELDAILSETGPDMDEVERIRREARQMLARSERDMLMGTELTPTEREAQDRASMWTEPVRGKGFSEATPIRPGLRPPGVGQDDYLRAREEAPGLVDASERAMIASMDGRRELDRLDAVTPEQAGSRLAASRARYDRTMGSLSPEEAEAIFGQLEAENLVHDRSLAAASGRPAGDMGRMARR